eukprot:4519398-Prymnesium_polylepis.1
MPPFPSDDEALTRQAWLRQIRRLPTRGNEVCIAAEESDDVSPCRVRRCISRAGVTLSRLEVPHLKSGEEP